MRQYHPTGRRAVCYRPQVSRADDVIPWHDVSTADRHEGTTIIRTTCGQEFDSRFAGEMRLESEIVDDLGIPAGFPIGPRCAICYPTTPASTPDARHIEAADGTEGQE